MSAYKHAVDRVRNHAGFISHEAFNQMASDFVNPDVMVNLIRDNGCLITVRHDINPRFSGRDFLVNLMMDMLVLHISTQGQYSLHRWQTGASCSEENRISEEREQYILEQLFEEESV